MQKRKVSLIETINCMTSYIYNVTNNELTQSTGPTTTSFGYDRNGNLASKNVTNSQWTYTWDVPGDLLKAANNSGVQGYYGYDGLGRRVESKEGSSTIFYGYLGTETLAEGVTNPYTDYIYANGLRIARVTGAYPGGSPAIFYFHTDALGSTRLVTDANRNVLFSDNYQPFGQDNQSTGAETYKFTGKPYSAAAGLYYLYLRWYDPSTGRLISQDPLKGFAESPQSLNAYVYSRNRPTSLRDPTGATGEEGGDCPQSEQCDFVIGGQFDERGAQPGNGSGGGWSEPTGSGGTGPTIEITTNPTETITTTEPTEGIGTQELIPTSDFFTQVEGEGAPSTTGWQLGDPVNSYTSSGNYPSWTTVRERIWKNEALNNAEDYSFNKDNLGRMQRGRAALDEEGNAFQIHHINGRDIPDPHNPANLEILTWLEHYLRHFMPIL